MWKVKVKANFSFSKLLRKMPNIFEEFNSDLGDKAEIFYKKNTEKGLDIHGKKFKSLTSFTKKQRKLGAGNYKTPIQHDKPLIASRNMINSIHKRKEKNTTILSVAWYGAEQLKERKGKFKNKPFTIPKREWFGVSENVIDNIVDIKKMSLFRRRMLKAFKK